MTKESIILGLVGILLGIGIIIKTDDLIFSSILIILGLALIIFYKEEDKIEKRRDKK